MTGFSGDINIHQGKASDLFMSCLRKKNMFNGKKTDIIRVTNTIYGINYDTTRKTMRAMKLRSTWKVRSYHLLRAEHSRIGMKAL